MNDLYKLPRVYVAGAMDVGQSLPLPVSAGHYLKNVLRRQTGDQIRLFNGQDGEFLGALDFSAKKDVAVTIEEKIKDQPASKQPVTLLFPPLKKDALDMLIEKSVELGVDALVPVMTDHADVRHLNEDRLKSQIVEAAEQCERLTIPALSALRPLRQVVADYTAHAPVFVALERVDVTPIAQAMIDKHAPNAAPAFLIGPAGGWSDAEKEWLQVQKNIVPVSLGHNILRAETAGIAMLAYSLLREAS